MWMMLPVINCFKSTVAHTSWALILRRCAHHPEHGHALCASARRPVYYDCHSWLPRLRCHPRLPHVRCHRGCHSWLPHVAAMRALLMNVSSSHLQTIVPACSPLLYPITAPVCCSCGRWTSLTETAGAESSHFQSLSYQGLRNPPTLMSTSRRLPSSSSSTAQTVRLSPLCERMCEWPHAAPATPRTAHTPRPVFCAHRACHSYHACRECHHNIHTAHGRPAAHAAAHCCARCGACAVPAARDVLALSANLPRLP